MRGRRVLVIVVEDGRAQVVAANDLGGARQDVLQPQVAALLKYAGNDPVSHFVVRQSARGVGDRRQDAGSAAQPGLTSSRIVSSAGRSRLGIRSHRRLERARRVAVADWSELRQRAHSFNPVTPTCAIPCSASPPPSASFRSPWRRSNTIRTSASPRAPVTTRSHR